LSRPSQVLEIINQCGRERVGDEVEEKKEKSGGVMVEGHEDIPSVGGPVRRPNARRRRRKRSGLVDELEDKARGWPAWR
jgi:hypothetical protein